MKTKYDIKSQYLGPEAGHASEIRVLNRVLRWTRKGVEYEADQRHSELIVREMGMQAAKPVATPGASETKEEIKAYQTSPEMNRSDATVFRGLAARLNYLSMDRPDLQFSAKEVAKRMAKPREEDWSKLKRVARYLVGAPRLVQKFQWQRMPEKLHTFTDSDWAGDRESRKSTSGGAITWGCHTIKTWSTTQQTIALSSGEAELYALVKGAAQSHGIASMLWDFGIEVGCTVCTDASAAIGMVHRQGLGKTRHIDVQYLWVQKDVYDGKIAVVKVGTDANPADVLTKHLKADAVAGHLDRLGYEPRGGRSSTAPDLLGISLQQSQADGWETRTTGDHEIVRQHRKPRISLFTQMKVAGGPRNATSVGSMRVTIGKYADNQTFCMVDKWKVAAEPHQQMEQPWTGTTFFLKDQSG